MSLNGRHVAVTGGGSGVGFEIARRFAGAGARVTVLGRRAGPLEAAAQAIGGRAERCDVTDPAALSWALDGARAAYGPIAIAVANAGGADSKPFSAMTAADLESALSVNLLGVFNLWRAALDDMKAVGWGRMIAVASTAGLKGYGYVSGYCAAKHGVVGLTRALAQELARSAITVNALCPGFVETPMLARSVENIVAKTAMSAEAAEASLRAHNPQGRFVAPEEVADAALWLAGPGAASVNGCALPVAGGEI